MILTRTRQSVYLSNQNIAKLKKVATMQKTSMSKILDEVIDNYYSNKPKNNLSKWIAKDMSEKDFEQIQAKTKRSIESRNRQKELSKILESE